VHQLQAVAVVGSSELNTLKFLKFLTQIAESYLESGFFPNLLLPISVRKPTVVTFFTSLLTFLKQVRNSASN
jgi:hypothetical protein